MLSQWRPASRRGFSIVEAIIALGLVLLALVGLFAIMPFTYNAIGDDALRAEATTDAHRYLDDVRAAVQSGDPVPAPTIVPLYVGTSMATGQASRSTPTATLAATCSQPDGTGSPLYDCSVSIVVAQGDKTRTLSPIETFITRQLP